jgi:hypothetical protein
MKGNKHALESLLLALLSANIPTLRLIGALKAAGFHVPMAGLVNADRKSYSSRKVRALIHARIKLCQDLFWRLEELYGKVDIQHRREDGVLMFDVLGFPFISFFAPDHTPEEVAIELEKTHFCDKFQKDILYLYQLERAFVHAIKTGDGGMFHLVAGWEYNPV